MDKTIKLPKSPQQALFSLVGVKNVGDETMYTYKIN